MVATATWKFDGDVSRLSWDVRYLTLSRVAGRIEHFEGTVELDEGDVSRSSVQVTLDPRSVRSGEEARDRELGTTFLGGNEFPEIRFRSTKIEPLDAERLLVWGELDLRGVRRELRLDTRLREKSADFVRYTAKTQFDRKTFGVDWNSALDVFPVFIGKMVQVSIDLRLRRA